MVNVRRAPKRVGIGWCLGSAGVSLIELLIAMAISSVAISASIQVFSALGLRFTAQHLTMVTNQDLRLGLDVLCSEIRLAGIGLLGGDSPFVKAESDEIEFFANLSAASTMLTQVTEIGRQDLPVEEGAGWPKGKQLLVCTAVHCAWNRLAADAISIMTARCWCFATSAPQPGTLTPITVAIMATTVHNSTRLPPRSFIPSPFVERVEHFQVPCRFSFRHVSR